VANYSVNPDAICERKAAHRATVRPAQALGDLQPRAAT
jgi:hypothetical protein